MEIIQAELAGPAPCRESHLGGRIAVSGIGWCPPDSAESTLVGEARPIRDPRDIMSERNSIMLKFRPWLSRAIRNLRLAFVLDQLDGRRPLNLRFGLFRKSSMGSSPNRRRTTSFMMTRRYPSLRRDNGEIFQIGRKIRAETASGDEDLLDKNRGMACSRDCGPDGPSPIPDPVRSSR